VRFIFGYDARNHVVLKAEGINEKMYRALELHAERLIETKARTRPDNVKEAIVVEREYKNIRTTAEDVVEFDYQPGNCTQAFRIVALRKNLTITRGETALFHEYRYFFYITNDRVLSIDEVVHEAHQRCNQENLISQLKSGAHALHAPVNTMIANGAYMLMASLAWTLKAWFALSLPVSPRWEERHLADRNEVLRMEFRTFVNAIINIPAQIIRAGRRIIFRLLAWNRWEPILFRFIDTT
jgi:hypothetical protein